jgi:hypothetical protein
MLADWFAGTDKSVSRDVFGCRLCHASTPIAMIGKALISFNISLKTDN